VSIIIIIIILLSLLLCDFDEETVIYMPIDYRSIIADMIDAARLIVLKFRISDSNRGYGRQNMAAAALRTACSCGENSI